MPAPECARSWGLDYLYVLVFRTFRLDVVELTRLPDGGVQMLFTNPTGFEPHAGEFIKVKAFRDLPCPSMPCHALPWQSAPSSPF